MTNKSEQKTTIIKMIPFSMSLFKYFPRIKKKIDLKVWAQEG